MNKFQFTLFLLVLALAACTACTNSTKDTCPNDTGFICPVKETFKDKFFKFSHVEKFATVILYCFLTLIDYAAWCCLGGNFTTFVLFKFAGYKP